MNEEQRFISFYDENSDNFYELLDGVRSYLKNNNKEYKDLQDIIEKESYFKGGMDAYYYFFKLGIIKNK